MTTFEFIVSKRNKKNQISLIRETKETQEIPETDNAAYDSFEGRDGNKMPTEAKMVPDENPSLEIDLSKLHTIYSDDHSKCEVVDNMF